MNRLFKAALFVVVLIASVNTFAQSESRDAILKQIQAKRAELKDLETRFLAPAPEDVAGQSEILQQPDAGIVRLLPRETFDNNTLTTRGGGAYYSFTRHTHEYGRGTQIGLEQDSLGVVFAGADLGMLARLGDVPLSAVNGENAAVKFLTSYEPTSEEPQARAEYQKFATGVKVGDVLFKTHQQAIVNNTYVLRGIHYSDSDVIVAFRIVRKDLDDSLTVVWKLLKTYPKPVLARGE